MHRRTLLGSLLASVAGLAFAPGDLLWRPVSGLALPPVAPDALLTLRAITFEAARQLSQLVSGEVIEGRLGDGRLTHQLSVYMLPPVNMHEQGLSREQVIIPAMELLAKQIRPGAPFGRLPILKMWDGESVTVASEKAGVALRGSLEYDIGKGRPLLRFAVLSGR